MIKATKIIVLAVLIIFGIQTTAQVSINTDLYCYDNGAASEWKEMTIGLETITPAQPLSCGEGITDERDGSSYNTVLIGSQCWMAENLNIGVMISGNNDQTNNSTIEKYCYENNTSNCDTYGGLYQWDEMMQYVTTEGTQGICPTGWHLPSNVEWIILSDFLGGAGVAGGKLKESGTNHWASPNTGGTNESSFYALPGGFLYSNDMFFDIGEIAYLWTNNMNDNTKSYGYYLYYNLASLSSYNDDKSRGNSVRCLMD